MSSYDSIDQALNVENTTETSIVGVGDKKSRDLVVSDKTNDIDALASLICACDLVISIDNFLVQFSGIRWNQI